MVPHTQSLFSPAGSTCLRRRRLFRLLLQRLLLVVVVAAAASAAVRRAMPRRWRQQAAVSRQTRLRMERAKAQPRSRRARCVANVLPITWDAAVGCPLARACYVRDSLR